MSLCAKGGEKRGEGKIMGARVVCHCCRAFSSQHTKKRGFFLLLSSVDGIAPPPPFTHQGPLSPPLPSPPTPHCHSSDHASRVAAIAAVRIYPLGWAGNVAVARPPHLEISAKYPSPLLPTSSLLTTPKSSQTVGRTLAARQAVCPPLVKIPSLPPSFP